MPLQQNHYAELRERSENIAKIEQAMSELSPTLNSFEAYNEAFQELWKMHQYEESMLAITIQCRAAPGCAWSNPTPGQIAPADTRASLGIVYRSAGRPWALAYKHHTGSKIQTPLISNGVGLDPI